LQLQYLIDSLDDAYQPHQTEVVEVSKLELTQLKKLYSWAGEFKSSLNLEKEQVSIYWMTALEGLLRLIVDRVREKESGQQKDN